MAARSSSRATKGASTPVYAAKAIGASDSLGDVISTASSSSKMHESEIYHMLLTKHPYVRTCASLIADAVASEGYAIAPIAGDDAKPVPADDDRAIMIHKFFRFAFVGMTERMARWAAVFDICGHGKSYWLKKRAGKLIVGLERIDPRTIEPRLNKKKNAIDKYVVTERNTDGQITVGTNQTTLYDPADIVRFMFEGGDPLLGLPSKLEALDLTLAQDFAVRRFRESYFRKGIRPGAVLTNATATPDQIESTEKRLRKRKAGADNAYDFLMLAGDWKVESMSSAGENDSDFIKGSGLNREEVAGVFSVPVGMITFSGSSLGSSGKGEDRDFFEEFAVLPIEEMFYETISLALLRDEFQIDDIDLVPKRRNRVRLGRFDAAVKSVKFGATGNEARVLVGLPAIVDPKFEMDTPLFIGAGPNGLVTDEPIEGAEPVNPGDDLQGATNAAAGAKDKHDEVAQKGAKAFRRSR